MASAAVRTREPVLEIDDRRFGSVRRKLASCVDSQRPCTQSGVVTFHVSRRRREMYCGHARLCVCVSVGGRMPTLSHGPGCNLEW